METIFHPKHPEEYCPKCSAATFSVTEDGSRRKCYRCNHVYSVATAGNPFDSMKSGACSAPSTLSAKDAEQSSTTGKPSRPRGPRTAKPVHEGVTA